MRSDRRALIVGIDDYEYLPLLPFALNDALRIENVLSSYPCQFGTILCGSEIKRNELRNKFRQLFTDADENAVLLFYYAGHGNTIDGGTYLITKGDAETEHQDGVHFGTLVEIVGDLRRPNQSVIFILDCCHAGALNVEGLKVDANNLQKNHVGSSIVLLAATEPNHKSYEADEYENGVFTHWVCQGLSGSAANNIGVVTPNSLFDYVSEAMKNSGAKQNPLYKVSVMGSNAELSKGHKPINSLNDNKLSTKMIEEIILETQQIIKKSTEMLKVWPASARDLQLMVSGVTQWHKDLVNKHSELNLNTDFQSLENDVSYLRAQLANRLDIGVQTSKGEITRKIGEGGFGIVYEVKADDGKTYAYKVYHANQLHEKSKVKAFQRGYNAMQVLKEHQRIVDVHDLTLAPLGFYMDYIEGYNLATWWHDNDLSEMLSVLIQIAQTLDYSHSHIRRVIHRDIKPENILISTKNEKHIPYLTDFDLSWYSMSTTYSSMGGQAVFGHYLYAAPEQINTPEDDSTRRSTTDIYSFGQLSYFVIKGKHPNSLAEHSRESLKQSLESWSFGGAASMFMEFYKKCTQQTPSNRYQSMLEVVDILIKIRSLVIDPDMNSELSPADFIKEMNFQFRGLIDNPQKSLLSISGRTHVDIS